MSFGSDSLFTAFDADGWSVNAAKAPTIDDAYKELPQADVSDRGRLFSRDFVPRISFGGAIKC